jgi:hypothetical protein
MEREISLRTIKSVPPTASFATTPDLRFTNATQYTQRDIDLSSRQNFLAYGRKVTTFRLDHYSALQFHSNAAYPSEPVLGEMKIDAKSKVFYM